MHSYGNIAASSVAEFSIKFIGITSQYPSELPAVLKYPLKLQKLSIYTLELSIALNLDPSVQIRAQNF
jgi:hypothetical protein